MPWDAVMGKFKTGQLHSGSDTGPVVQNRKQAIAIMLSEKKKAATNPEYASKKKLPKGRMAAIELSLRGKV